MKRLIQFVTICLAILFLHTTLFNNQKEQEVSLKVKKQDAVTEKNNLRHISLNFFKML
jgi:hypothetical protein